MLNQECRVYLKRIKVFQNLQKAGEYIFILGSIATGLGFIYSIPALIKNTNPDFMFTSLTFGLITLCLTNLITELAHISELRTYEKLKQHLHHYNLP